MVAGQSKFVYKAAPFASYDEIPEPVREYVLTVSEADTIEDLKLRDINVFLLGLEAYYKNVREEYEDGWVL